MTGTESSVFETLSDAETAYFNSKGEDVSGFAGGGQQENPASGTQQPTQAETAQNGTGAHNTGDGAQNSPEGDDDEGVYLDEHGKARSVATGKYVPHAALHKERSRRKEVEAENLTMREKMARAEERLSVLNEVLMATDDGQQQPGQQQAKKTIEEELGPAPDPERDIFAYVRWQQKKIDLQERRFNEMATTQQRAQEAASNQQASQQFQQAYQQDAVRFMQEKPDFPEAYKFIANSFANELKSMGLDDNAIRQRLMQEEAVLVHEAFQRKMSPSQVIYERARARGYNPSQAAQQQQNGQQKIQQIQKGQKATASLSSAGGSGGDALTMEALADMSEAEFEATYKRLGKSKFKSLIGG